MKLNGDNLTTINPLCATVSTVYSHVGLYTMNCLGTVITSSSGLPLNSYVVWLILRGAGSGINLELFTFNLALNDILVFTGFLSMPFINFCQQSILKALDFFHGFLITGRALFQTCICVERYLAVIHPVLFLKYKPLRYRLVCSAMIWIMTINTCVVLSFTRGVTETFWFAVYVPLFGVMLFCCLAVLRGLCKPGPGEGERERERANQAKMKAFRIITVIAALQLLTITTMIIAYHAYLNFDPHKREIIMAILQIFLMSACLTQPLLYLHRAGKLPCLITL